MSCVPMVRCTFFPFLFAVGNRTQVKSCFDCFDTRDGYGAKKTAHDENHTGIMKNILGPVSSLSGDT